MTSLRQFNTAEEVDAALSALPPGGKFYLVFWKEVVEYECYGLKTSDEKGIVGSRYAVCSPNDPRDGKRAFIDDMQNNPNKGVFTDRALAEKFAAVAQTWNEDPTNARNRVYYLFDNIFDDCDDWDD